MIRHAQIGVGIRTHESGLASHLHLSTVHITPLQRDSYKAAAVDEITRRELRTPQVIRRSINTILPLRAVMRGSALIFLAVTGSNAVAAWVNHRIPAYDQKHIQMITDSLSQFSITMGGAALSATAAYLSSRRIASLRTQLRQARRREKAAASLQ